MKIKQVLAILTVTAFFPFASISRATDIVATGSGNWTSTNADAPWPGGIVPGTNDDTEIDSPNVVTVDSIAFVQYIYSDGTVTMAPGSTLNVVGDPLGADATYRLTGLLDTSAPNNTVIYSGNPFWAKHQDYDNLIFSNTITTSQIDFYNGFVNTHDPSAPMTISGDFTVIGKIKVQLGDDMTILGNLTLSTNAQLDCSLTNLIVMGDTTLGTGALLFDGDGADGTNYFAGNLTVSSTALGWNVGDGTNWILGANLTNNGLIVGAGYGSISFNGTGNITGKPFTIPTMTVNGTYTIGTTITLITNTPTLNGTLVFDLANTNEIVLLTNAGTALFYSGALNVINTGPAPVAGNTYKLFNAPSYGGAFSSTNLPALASGLSWVDNTLINGSFAVAGSAVTPPTVFISRSGGLLTLSWDSTNFPGYSVQALTNSAGIVGTNWGATGSGTNSPYSVAINPSGPPVFFRLSKP